MFNNWINADDFALLARRIREGGLTRIVRRITGSQQDRVELAWRKSEIPPTNWWDIPEVVTRWNVKITGSPTTDFNTYVAETHLSSLSELTAISLGCGTGIREQQWARTGKFKRIAGYDLSEPRIDTAVEAAEKDGLSDILKFQVADVFEALDVTCDVVIVEGSLHHFSPLEEILNRIDETLADNGLLLVNEFVGPTQFQWTDRQLQEINQLLTEMPPRLRTRLNGTIKKRVGRPSKLCIRYGDPSEAIESSRIMPLLDEIFTPIDVKFYGGTILHMLFHEIAHHFRQDDPESAEWLQRCFDREDALTESGDLTSDFVAGVYRKRRPCPQA